MTRRIGPPAWPSATRSVKNCRSATYATPRTTRFRLAYRLQADRYGDLDDENRRLLDHSETPETAARRALGSTRRSTEVRPGTVFSREWNGQIQQVTVLADGFAWSGKTYPSLSKVAFAITGSRWNGPRFFGLRDAQSKVPST
jgi:hypothetical protein